MSLISQNHSLSATDLVALWLEHERMNGASPATISTYSRSIKAWGAWLKANSHTDPISPIDVQRFKIDLKGYAVQTVNVRLSAVRSFYRFLVTTGRMASNPASEVKGAKRHKSTTHKRDALTTSEIRVMLDNCQVGTMAGLQLKAMLTLFAYCGLRQVEVQRVSIGNLKTQGDRLVLWVQGKGHTEADEYVVIPILQEQVIRNWLVQRMTFVQHSDGDALFVSLSNRNRGQRMTTRAIRGLVKKAMAQAGIVGNKSTHSLRHTTITTAIKRGATPMQVQAMARHASFDTTLGYFHETARLNNPAEDLIEF